MTIIDIANKLGCGLMEDTPKDKAQSALNQHLFFSTPSATHIKTGNQYWITGVYLNCTNAQDGQWMIRYEKIGSDFEFVREATEFFEKFELGHD